MSAENDESEWFFDMIIGFLRSPRWKTPVMSFLDENCIKFDATEDENKLEFTTIHNSFKKMVEGLLEELMRELGVTDEQFVQACEKAAKNPIHKKIVDQIMAVDNFTAFKRLMIKRNTELNQQVLMAEKVQQQEAAGLPDKTKAVQPKAATSTAGTTQDKS